MKEGEGFGRVVHKHTAGSIKSIQMKVEVYFKSRDPISCFATAIPVVFHRRTLPNFCEVQDELL